MPMISKTHKQNTNSTKKANIPEPASTKPMKDYVSSSEEDEELDETIIIDSLYKHYNATKTPKDNVGAHKNGFLENVIQSGATSCLICIATVRRNDSIWSCRFCYCIFHLNCIRRWSKDSIAQQRTKLSQQQNEQGYYNHLGEFVPPKRARSVHWCCPQCRVEYEPTVLPELYECFCGKEINPTPQPWLVPHSCGEICGKPLKPDCGHNCLLLCHPGPCPPCAQYALTTCLCTKSAKKSVRCADKTWQCEQLCQKTLSCGEHLCNKLCHQLCPPCSRTSMQSCECGNETKKRSCSDLKWHCKKICGKKYACGLHTCNKICHADDCGVCPLSLPRLCPCGKTKFEGSCTDVIDTCGDTCQKLLPCGIHYCAQRCHKEACNPCFIITKKRCRCGMHEKELPCSKDFTCETKCKQMRDCGKHPCSRKCCDGNCQPCDKICGKTLSCKKHKCQSICHDGPCYPCKIQSQVNCSCGKTSKQISCGRERTTKIFCPEPCRIPSKCHHQNKHRCHKKECPPCTQKCGLPNDTSGCGHICETRCHAAVKIFKKPDLNPVNAWPQQPKPEYKCLPHPRCEQKITVTCIGGHEVAEWPCWNSKPSSCQRLCNRLLCCGNHKCQLVCHAVANLEDMNEQNGCASCEEGCNLPRAPGCIHPCPRPCHPPPCNPCNAIVRSKCHCGLTQVVYTCAEFFANIVDETEQSQRQERLRSCGDRCQKNYPCGHRCASICHSGKCPAPENCRKKVRIFCACKRLKSEISCDKQRSGLTQLDCNENCVQRRFNTEQEKEKEAERQRQLEAEKNRIEVEQFEKKFSKKKFKERKIEEKEKTERDINWKMIGIYIGIFVSILLAIGVALYAD